MNNVKTKIICGSIIAIAFIVMLGMIIVSNGKYTLVIDMDEKIL